MKSDGMKVLLVNSVYGVGSTGKIVRDLYDQINAAGGRAMVCYGRGDQVDDQDVHKICTDIEFYLHAGLSRITGLNGCFSNSAANRLIKEIEQFAPDIIHFHNLHGYYLNYYKLVEYVKSKNIPVIWTLHDELMFTGNCSYAYTCEKWMTGCSKCPQKKEYPKSQFFDTSRYLYNKKKSLLRAFSNCTYVTPSAWLGDRVKCSFLNCQDVRTIPNGIDVERVFTPNIDKNLMDRIDPEHKKIILTVTDDVHSARKGIQEFLKLADMNPEYLFIIVGGELNDGYKPNVKWITATKDQKELSYYYSMASVFVITSLCDNFPTVCLEALACGTPIVGFNTGGTPETAPDKSIGVFCSYGDMDSMTEGIKSFLSFDREMLRKLCREYAVDHYSRQQMTESYLQLYHELASKEN